MLRLRRGLVLRLATYVHTSLPLQHKDFKKFLADDYVCSESSIKAVMVSLFYKEWYKHLMTVKLIGIKSKSDALDLTLRFKKHKTTVLLILPSLESIESTKEKLLKALKTRGILEINGDPVHNDSYDIVLGVPVDRNELEKGWTRLDFDDPDITGGEAMTNGAGRKKRKPDMSLGSADIRDGQPIAFRFRRPREEVQDMDEVELELELEDPAWDVIIPALDDAEPE